MSSMAKIFVVLNLILGVMCFGAAATLLGAQDDYKTELIKVSQEFEAFKTDKAAEVQDLESRLAQQNAKAAQELARANSVAGENESLKKDLAAARDANGKLRTSVEAFSQQLEGLRKVNQNFQATLQKMGEESRQATTDKLDAVKKLEEEVANRVRLEQEVARQGEAIQTLAAEKGDLSTQLREANFWLNKYREKFGDITGGSEGAEGKVLEVKTGEFGVLVGISVGTADKVKVGDVYHIRRGTQYVGRITIDKVYKNQAVGVFDSQFAGSGAPPQRGDWAYPGN